MDADCPWERYKLEDTAKYYYHNKETGVTVWDPPEEWADYFAALPDEDDQEEAYVQDGEGEAEGATAQYDDSGLVASGDREEEDIFAGDERSPLRFSPSEIREDDGMEVIGESSFADNDQAVFEQDEEEEGGGWGVAHDDQGRAYYYKGDETVWEEPEEYTQWRERKARREEGLADYSNEEQLEAQYEAGMDEVEEDTATIPSVDQVGEKAAEVEKAVPEDPAKKAERLLNMLQKPDAIMEPNAFLMLREYAEAAVITTGKTARDCAGTGIASLVNSYAGVAGYANVAAGWLSAIGVEGTPPSAEDVIQEQLEQLIKSHFDTEKVDKIFDRGSLPEWLDEILKTQRWRRTIIELFDTHRECVLLRFLIQKISEQGRHAEIAVTVSVGDIFHVFNGVLTDYLGQLPTCNSVKVMQDHLPYLKRTCCSTDYMFAYTQELLLKLEQAASEFDKKDADGSHNSQQNGSQNGQKAAPGSSKLDLKDDDTDAVLKSEPVVELNGDKSKNSKLDESMSIGTGTMSSTRKSVSFGGTCAHKFRRVREELVVHAMEEIETAKGDHLPPKGQAVHALSVGAGTGVSKKRKRALTDADIDGADSAEEKLRPSRSDVEREVVNLVRGTERHKTLPRGGAMAAEPLVKLYNLGCLLSAKDKDAKFWEESEVLRPPVEHLRHPIVFRMLIEAAFHTQLKNSLREVRRRCCALLACASCGGSEGGWEEVLDTFTRLDEASELCQSSKVTNPKEQDKLRKYVELPVVSAAVLMWAQSQASNKAITTAPLYLSLAPIFLDMCVITINMHPLQWPTVLELLKCMMKVRRDDKGGVDQAVKLKKEVLRTMIHLMGAGYVEEVMSYIYFKLDDDDNRLDLSLLRFFLGSLLIAALPITGDSRGHTGYSRAYVEAMLKLLAHHRVTEAIFGENFDKGARVNLSSFLNFCLQYEVEGTEGAQTQIDELLAKLAEHSEH